MNRISAIVGLLFCLLAGDIQAASPVFGRGADSGRDVAGRMLLNTSVYGRQQEANVYRGGQTIGEAVMSTANLVAYWPLRQDGAELVAGNTMVLTNVAISMVLRISMV
jgi:hypothetical protein